MIMPKLKMSKQSRVKLDKMEEETRGGGRKVMKWRIEGFLD